MKTNVTATATTLTGVPSGDFYINTNVCGPNLILTNYPFPSVATTNLIYAASNSAGLFTSQSLVTYSNMTALIVQPIVCGAASGGGGATNAPGLYQGIGKVQFVKTTYDSLIGQFWQPVTNSYTMQLVSNSKLVKQTFQRVVTFPDFLLTAQDTAGGPDAPPATPTYARTNNYNVSNVQANHAGPGTIDPTTAITFDKVGNVYGNTAGGNQASGTLLLQWASFDGSTNDPIIYPNGASLTNLANQILVQVSPSTLTNRNQPCDLSFHLFFCNRGSFFPAVHLVVGIWQPASVRFNFVA